MLECTYELGFKAQEVVIYYLAMVQVDLLAALVFGDACSSFVFMANINGKGGKDDAR